MNMGFGLRPSVQLAGSRPPKRRLNSFQAAGPGRGAPGGDRECASALNGSYTAPLRGVLGLLAPFLGAALQGLELSLQVLDEGGVGTLVDALKLVGVSLEVVKLLFPPTSPSLSSSASRGPIGLLAPF